MQHTRDREGEREIVVESRQSCIAKEVSRCDISSPFRGALTRSAPWTRLELAHFFSGEVKFVGDPRDIYLGNPGEEPDPRGIHE